MAHTSLPRSLVWVVISCAIATPFTLNLRTSLAQTPAPALEVPTALYIREELYFGLSLADGSTLSEAQWQEFLRTEITPRFPAGLTVIDAQGQWLNASGMLIREPTKVVILIYREAPERDRAIRDIITQYKHQFNQESVLRVTSTARISF
jgi:hypothetical protein